MTSKRAIFISYGKDDSCVETKSFIEESGVLLTIRDLEKRPFTVQELSSLVGHLDIRHFLNKSSEAYTGNGLDKELPDRQEIIKMMAADYTLIRKPIIKASRLITIGCDQKKVSELLQIGANNTPPPDDRVGNTGAHRKSGKKGGSGNGKR